MSDADRADLEADLESALRLAIVNLRAWRLGALEALPSEGLEALACELAATLDYVGELVAKRRAAKFSAGPRVRLVGPAG